MNTNLPNFSLKLGAAVLLLASLAYTQQTTEHPALAWFLQEKAKIEQRLADNRQREVMALQAIDRAQNALASADRLNDSEAIVVSRQAVNFATAALHKVRMLLARDESRLMAIQNGLERLRAMPVRESPPVHLERAPLREPRLSEIPAARPPSLLRDYRPSPDRGEMAVVTTVTGELYRKVGYSWVRFYGEVPLGSGDEIRSGASSIVELMFTDGSKIRLDSNTTFIVGDLNERESVYELLKGKLHAIRECFRSRELCGRNLRYRTSSLFSAPRGTEFTLELLADGRNVIIVLEGTVEVTGLKDKRTVTASAGQQVSTTPEGKMVGPTSVDLRSISRWWEE